MIQLTENVERLSENVSNAAHGLELSAALLKKVDGLFRVYLDAAMKVRLVELDVIEKNARALFSAVLNLAKHDACSKNVKESCASLRWILFPSRKNMPSDFIRICSLAGINPEAYIVDLAYMLRHASGETREQSHLFKMVHKKSEHNERLISQRLRLAELDRGRLESVPSEESL